MSEISLFSESQMSPEYESLLSDVAQLVMAHSNKEIDFSISYDHLARQIGDFVIAYAYANLGNTISEDGFAEGVVSAIKDSPLDYPDSPYSPENAEKLARQYWCLRQST